MYLWAYSRPEGGKTRTTTCSRQINLWVTPEMWRQFHLWVSWFCSDEVPVLPFMWLASSQWVDTHLRVVPSDVLEESTFQGFASQESTLVGGNSSESLCAFPWCLGDHLGTQGGHASHVTEWVSGEDCSPVICIGRSVSHSCFWPALPSEQEANWPSVMHYLINPCKRTPFSSNSALFKTTS